MSATRKRNPEKMKKICSFVEEYFFKYHRSPTMQKIADELGVSKSTAYYYINEMAEKGMLSYDGKTISTSSMQKSIHFANRAPMIGNIVCGTPEYSEENFEGYVALPEALFGVVKRITIEKKGMIWFIKMGAKTNADTEL